MDTILSMLLIICATIDIILCTETGRLTLIRRGISCVTGTVLCFGWGIDVVTRNGKVLALLMCFTYLLLTVTRVVRLIDLLRKSKKDSNYKNILDAIKGIMYYVTDKECDIFLTKSCVNKLVYIHDNLEKGEFVGYVGFEELSDVLTKFLKMCESYQQIKKTKESITEADMKYFTMGINLFEEYIMGYQLFQESKEESFERSVQELQETIEVNKK